jgi:hypothetical protein
MTGAVYRIWWTPGQDRLTAVCFCRARRECDDPITAWTWLLEHPTDHHPPPERCGADPGDATLQRAGAST